MPLANAMTARRLAGTVFSRLLLARSRIALARGLARLGRDVHHVTYFHQVDDAYSHLAAQALVPLIERYGLQVTVYLCSATDDAHNPEAALLLQWAQRDAADVAPFHGLAFPAAAVAPTTERTELATRALAGALRRGRFIDEAVAIGDAYWRGDRAALQARIAADEAATAVAERVALHDGNRRRDALGHYSGAMFHHLGEWYWGVDRLVHLERRLRTLGADLQPTAPWLYPRPAAPVPDRPARAVTLHYFPSLRSPYTAFNMRRVFDYADTSGVRLDVRPVLPMVMRNVPVPPRKGRYILLDALREAELEGTRFGPMVDPVGVPVERAYALLGFAREHGRERDLLLSFAEGAFLQGLDTGSERGLERIVRRAGLDWPAAVPWLARDGWRAEVEASRQAMYDLGLWGVPSFAVSGGDDPEVYRAWGQDRFWRVAGEVARRAAGSIPAG